MPIIIRKWNATLQQGSTKITVTMECPFFADLIEPAGKLTEHFECHALWDYYGAAMRSYERAKKNLVYEDELSLIFDQKIARNLFQGKANNHGVRPQDMVNFWPHCDRQRLQLGVGTEDLPEEFKFKWWGV